MESRVEHGAIVQCVAIEHAERGDSMTVADVAGEQGRTFIHGGCEITCDVAVGLMFDADRIGVAVADVPGFVGFAHHLCDLSIDGAQHVVGRGACPYPVVGAVLEPCDRSGVGTLCVMDGYCRYFMPITA